MVQRSFSNGVVDSRADPPSLIPDGLLVSVITYHIPEEYRPCFIAFAFFVLFRATVEALLKAGLAVIS